MSIQTSDVEFLVCPSAALPLRSAKSSCSMDLRMMAFMEFEV